MSEQRESPYGYSFYHTYQECPYKFWLKNYFGLIPNENRMELERGKIVHNLFYVALAKSVDDAYKEATIADDRMKFPDATFTLILDMWVKQRYEKVKSILVETEGEHEIMFGPKDEQLKYTFRIDRRILDPELERYGIVDTKVTGKDVTRAVESFERTNQFLSYKWASQIKFPAMKDPFVELEIVSITKRNGIVIMPVTIEYSKLEEWEWEASLYGIICEINQKIKSLEKYPHQVLFPRNRGFMCNWCPYDELCMQDPNRCTIPEEKFHMEERNPLIKDIVKSNGGDKWLVNLQSI